MLQVEEEAWDNGLVESSCKDVMNFNQATRGLGFGRWVVDSNARWVKREIQGAAREMHAFYTVGFHTERQCHLRPKLNSNAHRA